MRATYNDQEDPLHIHGTKEDLERNPLDILTRQMIFRVYLQGLAFAGLMTSIVWLIHYA